MVADKFVLWVSFVFCFIQLLDHFANVSGTAEGV